jgi:hypothetical protein
MKSFSSIYSLKAGVVLFGNLCETYKFIFLAVYDPFPLFIYTAESEMSLVENVDLFKALITYLVS